VLVDRYTASAAELMTAALQDAEAAVVVGEPTYGKGVIQSMFSITTGGAIIFTTEEYLRRSGKRINEIGVMPNTLIADMNPRYYETKSDMALIKALDFFTP
jgi:carboxyl-terminal processing protease